MAGSNNNGNGTGEHETSIHDMPEVEIAAKGEEKVETGGYRGGGQARSIYAKKRFTFSLRREGRSN